MPKSERIDVTKILAQDHRTVEDLFEQFEKARGADRKQKLVQQLCTELNIHTMLEEEIFYPALRGKIEEDMLDEAYVEHDSAKILIMDLEAAEPDEDFYDAKVAVLKEQIEHHVGEEERQNDSIFAQARKSDADLQMLGEQVAERKQQLMKEAKAGQLSAPMPHTMER